MRCFLSANRNYAENAIAMHVRGMSRSMQSHADKVISPKFGDENKSFERKVGQEKHEISQTKNTTHPHFARQRVEENHFENMYEKLADVCIETGDTNRFVLEELLSNLLWFKCSMIQ